MKLRKKLIEVALPLEAINIASAREKSIRHGHPSTLHLWWARRPLAAARAVIFAQMVDDPGDCPELFPTSEAQEIERKRLFQLIEQLVLWENTNNEEVIEAARAEILASWRRACADNADHPQADELFNPEKLPAFHDPFAGGGALPLEAQRLGLESHASDLNPVAVLINKAMIEIPPKFAGRTPVNPHMQKQLASMGRDWSGAKGLAEDVRYYGEWMREEASRRIGHLYPKVKITAEMAEERPDLKNYIGKELTVIAWIWARTVKSPNPAFAHVDVPLASTFMLSTKVGKEAYIEPVINSDGYVFKVKVGKPNSIEKTKLGTTAGKRAAFRCIMSNVPISYEYIGEQGKNGLIGSILMAIVVEGKNSRIYISPIGDHVSISNSATPNWVPELELSNNIRNFNTPKYGLTTFGNLFTSRQLVALNTFSDLVGEARERIWEDAIQAGMADDGIPLRDGGIGAGAYAEAVGVYLGFGVSKSSDYWSSICSWHNSGEKVRNTFGRQAIPMVWDYTEGNVFSSSTGSFSSMLNWIYEYLIQIKRYPISFSYQADASVQNISHNKVISTDPPYYDNIGYADLSDFFYVWLRKMFRNTYPEIFNTLSVPKTDELVATPYRHGNKRNAESFFLDGMTKAIGRISNFSNLLYPVTIYYAFKQSESDKNELQSTRTGWETFLEAVIKSRFRINGTWPMRTELGNRMIGNDTNALASSIVLVCRKKENNLPNTSRRDFISLLKTELPDALRKMQEGNIAPVDLAQASIGPGMAIYTRYDSVLDSEGNKVSVRDALALINQVLDETLSAQDSEFDSDTRFALAWFDEHAFDEASFGEAMTLARAKNTSVEGLEAAGIVASSRGKVRLLRAEELPEDWNPESDDRLTVWEAVHHLCRRLETSGEEATAFLAQRLGAHSDSARELAYRLYSICERQKRSQEALTYNALVQSWPEISRLSRRDAKLSRKQGDLF